MTANYRSYYAAIAIVIALPILSLCGCISVGRIPIPRDAARVMMAVVVDEYRTPDQAIAAYQKQSFITIDPIRLIKLSPNAESRKWVRDFGSITKTEECFDKLEEMRHKDIYKWIEILLTLKEKDESIVKQGLAPLMNENKELFSIIVKFVLK